MGRFVLAPALEVIAQPLDHPERVRNLQVRIEAAIQDAIIDRVGVACDVGDQGHDRLFELGEDRFQLRGRHAWFAAVEERIVRTVLVTDRICDPAV